jgi:hypothetical protein
MSNMSYCRFENTNDDLMDCVVALEEMSIEKLKELSEYEARALKSMIKNCQRFLDQAEFLELIED